MSDEVLHLLEGRLTSSYSLFNESEGVLHEVQLIHDLVKSLLDLWPQHLEGGSNSLVSEHLSLWLLFLLLFVRTTTAWDGNLDSLGYSSWWLLKSWWPPILLVG